MKLGMLHDPDQAPREPITITILVRIALDRGHNDVKVLDRQSEDFQARPRG